MFSKIQVFYYVIPCQRVTVPNICVGQNNPEGCKLATELYKLWKYSTWNV